MYDTVEASQDLYKRKTKTNTTTKEFQSKTTVARQRRSWLSILGYQVTEGLLENPKNVKPRDMTLN